MWWQYLELSKILRVFWKPFPTTPDLLTFFRQICCIWFSFSSHVSPPHRCRKSKMWKDKCLKKWSDKIEVGVVPVFIGTTHLTKSKKKLRMFTSPPPQKKNGKRMSEKIKFSQRLTQAGVDALVWARVCACTGRRPSHLRVSLQNCPNIAPNTESSH